jgi:hypothetical protein
MVPFEGAMNAVTVHDILCSTHFSFISTKLMSIMSVGDVYDVCQTCLQYVVNTGNLSDVFVESVSHVYGIRQTFLWSLYLSGVFIKSFRHVY